ASRSFSQADRSRARTASGTGREGVDAQSATARRQWARVRAAPVTAAGSRRTGVALGWERRARRRAPGAGAVAPGAAAGAAGGGAAGPARPLPDALRVLSVASGAVSTVKPSATAAATTTRAPS